VPMSLDRDASDRSFDRQLAHFWGSSMMPHRSFARGPRFPVSASCSLSRAWVESGLFRISRKLYGEIGPAFYGLAHDLADAPAHGAAAHQAARASQGTRPGRVRQLLGLDARPEVKTLRRRLTRLAAHHLRRAAGRGACASACRSARTSHGVLVHRRPCARLSRPTRHRIKGLRGAPPSGHAASTDYWINDRFRRPVCWW